MQEPGLCAIDRLANPSALDVIVIRDGAGADPGRDETIGIVIAVSAIVRGGYQTNRDQIAALVIGIGFGDGGLDWADLASSLFTLSYF